MQEGVSVTVFFDEGLEDAKKQEIGELIGRRVEVREYNFISAEEAWEGFKEQYFAEYPEYAEGYTENPLEDSESYEIYLNDVSMQNALVTYLESLEGVRTVNKSKVMADMLTGANALIAYVSMGIIGILLAVSIFLISNTVMIGISVRKEEINVMKYIGATDFFVRSPFVVEGVMIGIVGSLIPIGIVYILYERVIAYMGERFSVLTGIMQFLPANEIFSVLVPIALGIGIGIGFLGSFMTVRKHLRV